MNYPRVNVEEAFDELVRELRTADIRTAVVLRDILSKDVSYPNADYLFYTDEVVAELKCMMDDNSESSGNQTKLNNLVTEYFNAGKITTKDITEESWKTFPKDFQVKVSEIFSHSIHARVKKANIQIRETKKQLKLDSYSGLLIIANDGYASMPPAAFIDTTIRTIEKDKRDYIDMFIYLTVNLFATIEGSPFPTVFWMPMSMKEPSRISENFINQIRMAWQAKVNKKMGITHCFDHQINDDDMGRFWGARHKMK